MDMTLIDNVFNMKSRLLLLMFLFISFTTFAQQKWNYPPTPKIPVQDTIWGTVIQDDYRWLENRKDSVADYWYKAQAEFTQQELDKIPGVMTLFNEMKEADSLNAVSYEFLVRRKERYFFAKRYPGEKQPKIYYSDGANGKETMLVDSDKYKMLPVFFQRYQVNDDGTKLMFMTFSGHKIMDVQTGLIVKDSLLVPYPRFLEGTVSDIVYDATVPSEMGPYQILKLHKLGKPDSTDITLVDPKKYPELGIAPNMRISLYSAENSPYVILNPWTVSRDRVYFYALRSELGNKKINWKKLSSPEDEVRDFVLNGSDIFLLTTKDNPNFKIIKTSLKNPDLKNAEIIGEGKGDWRISRNIMGTKDYFIFTELKSVTDERNWRYDFRTGKLTEMHINLPGSVVVHTATSKSNNNLEIMNTDWNLPYTLLSYNPETGKVQETGLTRKHLFSGLDEIVSEVVEVESHDGALVPLTIIYNKKKFKKDGNHTALMMGYGAYGTSPFMPGLDEENLSLLNRGVVLAMAHVRGGGEKGHEWYLGGKKTTKANSWKDFNACAEWLIKHKYTSPEKFGIMGGSAGGLLIGRAATSRPDLYRVAIPQVGNMNALRMEFTRNGPINIPEFGTIKVEEEFHALMEMDAMYNTKPGVRYPAQLVTAGWLDGAIDAFLPAKYVAKMQASNASLRPVFLHVDFEGGHTGASESDKALMQTAREYAFLLWQTGHPDFQPK